jgi:hypothetical protein
MPGRGHSRRLWPLIAGRAEAGVPTHVFTERPFGAAARGKAVRVQ